MAINRLARNRRRQCRMAMRRRDRPADASGCGQKSSAPRTVTLLSSFGHGLEPASMPSPISRRTIYRVARFQRTVSVSSLIEVSLSPRFAADYYSFGNPGLR